MAHNIYKNSMVYAGDVPWHGIGKKLPANATWEDINREGGFYNVRKEEILTASGVAIPGKRALVREDTNAPLAVVSDSYHVIQFEDVAKTIVEAAQGVDAIFHTAGLLGEDGARGWLLAELPRVLRVKGDESEIRPYLLGTAAHDGHHGVVLRNVATRVVCQNTLGVAMGESTKYHVAIHHTKNAGQRLDEARRAFGLLLQGMDELEEYANLLAGTPFSERQMKRTIDDLLPLDTEKTEDKQSKQLVEKRDRVLSLYETGSGVGAGIRGTAWAAFQAWTEYADHHRVVRDDGNGAKRLESVWLGRAADMKTDALAAITKAVAGRA
jgi:phage/plasmid-like protein (TIGR03299 family)